MVTDSVKIFQRTDSFKILVSIFALFMTLLVICFLIFIPQNILITIAYVFLISAVVFGCVIMVSDKVIVTSDAIVSENILRTRKITFKDIKRIYIKRIKNTYSLTVTTAQFQIGLQGGASKKQLEEMLEHILEKIRENDPEHYQDVNLPSVEVDDFCRE